MKKTVLLLTMLLMVLFGCKSKLKTREMGAYTFKTSCIGEQENKLLVSSWGQGKTKEECEKAALKKAVKDIIFKGIFDGNTNCQKPPILATPDAERKLSQFFQEFFGANGQYQNYATIYNEPRSQSHSKKIRKLNRVLNLSLEFQILVDRDGLVKLLSNKLSNN